MTMTNLEFGSLGETWLNLLNATVNEGARLGGEGFELLNVRVAFSYHEGDAAIQRFGNRQMIAEMHKVFFTDEPNSLGHSYRGMMRGPGGRQDFQDVIVLLRDESLSKRAVLTFQGPPAGKVPCINVVQFLVRDEALQAVYFARGQDAYKKFYADGICIATMARRVADGLGLPVGTVSGLIASSHVYDEDLPAIRQTLEQGKACLRVIQPEGVV